MLGLQIGVADVEVQAEFRQRIEEFRELFDGIKAAGEVLYHQTDAEAAGVFQEFA